MTRSRVRLALDLLRLAGLNVRRRPLRSLLTVIGIAVGMTAVVGLLGLSAGVQRTLARGFERLGHDLVLVLPGDARDLSPSQTMAIDLEAIRSLDGVAQAGALLRRTLPVSAGETQGFLVVLGLSPETFEAAERFFGRFLLSEGSLPAPGENAVLLTHDAARELNLDTGSQITISDREFTVSGVLRPLDDPQSEGAIFMPLVTSWTLTGSEGAVSLGWARAGPGVDVEALASRIEEHLSAAGPSVQVQTSARLNEIVRTVLNVLATALAAMAGLALFVGGVGLMNTMYTAVMERTREIGIFVSLGACPSQIVALYLMESGLLGLVGGVLGVMLGTGLALSLALVIAQVGDGPALASPVGGKLVGLALFFSMGLGMAAGLLPARRAAALRPVDALRYE